MLAKPVRSSKNSQFIKNKNPLTAHVTAGGLLFGHFFPRLSLGVSFQLGGWTPSSLDRYVFANDLLRF
jgi:hypothetical protein